MFIEMIKKSIKNAYDDYRNRTKYSKRRLLPDRTTYHASYSGNYVLTVETFQGFLSRGTVKAKSGRTIAVVDRNYSLFMHAFVEHHDDGHDYLICGENCYGQTIIQLDTGKRVDFVPKDNPRGFAWTFVNPSPDGKLLAVESGCWSSPYEMVFFDFSKPMMLPYPELGRIDDCDEFKEWVDVAEASFDRLHRFSIKFGKREEDLTPEQAFEVWDDEKVLPWRDVWKDVVDTNSWKRP